MDRLFGQRFFSRRRLLAVVVTTVFALAIPLANTLMRAFTEHTEIDWRIGLFPISFVITLVLFSLSISVTRLIAFRSAGILSVAPKLNFVVLAAMLIVQLCLLR